MKEKKIFKKWWFWLIIVVIILGVIGSLGKSNENTPNSTTDSAPSVSDNNSASTLPKLDADTYKRKEGLVVYKELKAEGYKVDAVFENQALTDINGKASDLFESLDQNNINDKQSVDAFVVGSLTQNGDTVTLTIVKSSN